MFSLVCGTETVLTYGLDLIIALSSVGLARVPIARSRVVGVGSWTHNGDNAH
jgi:hypothetical protein